MNESILILSLILFKNNIISSDKTNYIITIIIKKLFNSIRISCFKILIITPFSLLIIRLNKMGFY